MFWNTALFLFLLLLHAYLYGTTTTPASLAGFGGFAQGIALLLAFIYIGRVAFQTKTKDSRHYLLLALAFGVCFLAHLLLMYSELVLHQAATGSVTDSIWLIGYVLIARSLIGLLGSVLSKTEQIRWYLLIVVLISATVMGALWVAIRDPERTILIKMIQVVFPFLDLWIASMAGILAIKKSRVWLFGALGSLIIGISDLVFPYFHTISSSVYRYLDVPLFAGYSMWWLLGVALHRKLQKSILPLHETT